MSAPTPTAIPTPMPQPVTPCCDDMRIALLSKSLLVNGNRLVMINTPMDRPLRMCPYCGTAL